MLPAWYGIPLQNQVEGLQVPRSLTGAFVEKQDPEWTIDNWLKGKYGKDFQDYYREQHPMRGFFVRLRNQMDYQLYGLSENPRIEVGKGGQLFDTNYGKSYLGWDSIPKTDFQTLLDRLFLLADSVEAWDSQLLVLLPPGKQSVFPDLLPDFYKDQPHFPTNRQRLLDALAERGVAHMDFDFLAQQQDTAQWPLFPQGGLHWSLYGAALAGDSMLGYISALLDTRMVKPEYSLEIVEKGRDTDTEIIRAMNLWFMPSTPPLAEAFYEQKTDTLFRPRVLSISDSFYKIWYDQGFQQAAFHPASSFWYYGRTLLHSPKPGWETTHCGGSRLQKRNIGLRPSYSGSIRNQYFKTGLWVAREIESKVSPPVAKDFGVERPARGG